MAGWPVLGWLSRLQRTVFIERERKRTSGEQASEIARRLADGDAMVLFAEGTTGDGNAVLPFKSTLFGAADHGDRRRRGATGSISSRWPSPIRASTACRWAAGTARSPPGSATPNLCRMLPALLREGAVDVELHFGEPIEFSPGDDRKAATRRVEARRAGDAAGGACRSARRQETDSDASVFCRGKALKAAE